MFDHLHAMGQNLADGENGIPESGLYGSDLAPDRLYDYNLMAGNTPYGKYTVGAYTMSIHERTILGWLAPDALVSDQQGVTVRDLYTYGDAYQVEIGDRGTTRTMFIGNRQRHSYFDSLGTFDYPGRPPNANDWSLKTTGLSLELSNYPGGSNQFYDYVFADNTYAGSSYAVDHDGDMYGPTTTSQITPWTVPNVNGCDSYNGDVVCGQSDFTMTWQAIDNVRYTGGADDEMAFDFFADYRDASIVYIREDSWMGTETDGSSFAGEVRVTNGATLTIEDGITLTFEEGIRVDSGARLDTESGVTLKFDQGELLQVYGTLAAEGTTFEASNTNLGWSGVNVQGSATIQASSLVQHVRTFGGGAIYVAGSLDFLNSTVKGSTLGAGGHGIQAYGSTSDVLVEDGIIRDNEGYGVYAGFNGRVFVDQSEIFNNEDGGVYSGGGDVFLYDSVVDQSDGYGIHAVSNGYVGFGFPFGGYPTPSENTDVDDHASGTFYAVNNADVSAGSTTQWGQNNLIREGTELHVYSRTSSSVRAQCNWWGRSQGPVPSYRDSDGTSTLTYIPYLASQGGTCGMSLARQSGGADARDVTTRYGASGLRANGPSASDEGDFGPGAPAVIPQGVWDAMQLADQEEFDAAFGVLVAAIQTARSPEESQRAYATMMRIGRRGTSPATIPFLQAQSRRESERPYALQALAQLHQTEGNMDQSETASRALTEEYPETEHARFGWMMRYSLATGRGDRSAAEAVLGALQASRSEDEETAAMAYDYRMRFFDEAGEPSQRLRHGVEQVDMPSMEAASAAANAALPETTELGAAYPNPARGTLTLPLALAEDATLDVAVYDVLGRRVQTALAGRLAAGYHEARVEGAQLAPGVYVVQARVEGATASLRLQQRITVVQ
ncbi:MAG: right-handed parallel beta-helix repeat-containing protein [Bacteroidota bacterium]